MGKGGFDPTTSPSKEACLTTTSQFNCDIFTNFNLYVQTNWVDHHHGWRLSLHVGVQLNLGHQQGRSEGLHDLVSIS